METVKKHRDAKGRSSSVTYDDDTNLRFILSKKKNVFCVFPYFFFCFALPYPPSHTHQQR